MLKAIGLLMILLAMPAALIAWIWLAALGVYDVIMGLTHGVDAAKIFTGLLIWFGKELAVTAGMVLIFFTGITLYSRD